MVVQVIPEQHDAGDGFPPLGRVGKVAREEDKGDVAYVFRCRNQIHVSFFFESEGVKETNRSPVQVNDGSLAVVRVKSK